MSVVDAVMYSLHVVFAGLWTGSVLFFAGAVLPTAGAISAPALAKLATRLSWLTRAGALVFVATGGHMAGTRYTSETLFGTGRGHLVVTMLVLWFLLAATVEVGAKRLRDGAERSGAADAAEAARPVFLLAAALALLLLVDAGLLAAGLSFS